MKNQYKHIPLLLAIAVGLMSGALISGITNVSRTIPSSGTVIAINVEVYWDLGCTQNVSSIDWGQPKPGDVVNKTVYVKNSGSANMTLSMTTNSWAPAGASSYITLTWNREGVTVDADSVIAAVLSLDISDTIVGITDFSFNTVIEGTP